MYITFYLERLKFNYKNYSFFCIELRYFIYNNVNLRCNLLKLFRLEGPYIILLCKISVIIIIFVMNYINQDDRTAAIFIILVSLLNTTNKVKNMIQELNLTNFIAVMYSISVLNILIS